MAEKASTTTFNSDLVIIIIYFSIIVLSIIFFVVSFWLNGKKEFGLRVIEKINHQKAIENLVANIRKQLSILYQLPIRRDRLKPFELFQSLSWILLLCIIGSIMALIIGASKASALASSSDLSVKGHEIDQESESFWTQVLKLGTFLYVLSLNLFLILRQSIYYEQRQLVLAHDLRFQTLNQTNFNRFDRTWANYLQIFVLGLEFFQLLSFPIQDIITYIKQSDTSSSVDAGSIIGIATLLPNISASFYLVQFWTCMGAVICATTLALVLHFYNDKATNGVSLFWVSYLVPVVNVAYLPILVTFINSVACLFQGKGQHGFLKCSSKVVQPQLYIGIALAGFTVAYLLMTIFVTSYERKPIEGDIDFKSKGVAFIKNMGLLLTIDFSLIPATYNRVKGILSVIILTSVVIYSIRMRPCYVSQINFWRTAGFCCILWCALPLAILDLPHITWPIIVVLILFGWFFIIVAFVSVRFCVTHTRQASSHQINRRI